MRLKIDIQTSNDRNFLELAILFDKPEFLEWLPKIRKKYSFVTPAPLEKFDEFHQESFTFDKGKEFDMSLYEHIEGLSDSMIVNQSFFPDDLNPYQLLETDASILSYIFHRPPYFIEPIAQAILCGAVDGDIFQPTRSHIVENDLLLTTSGGFAAPQVVVSISPTSTDLEIKEQVSQARHLLNTDKRLTYYKPRVDRVNKIRAYREWYWQRLAGKSYIQISTEWIETPGVDSSDSGSDYNRVLKGISYYKKLLQI
ncbi:MAG TPA: hypothetical protein PLS49_06420 [Candidatus Woesebacteria bacterium]|nr:hypothetical protein [Candidatus Woesebacteria bacterium]